MSWWKAKSYTDLLSPRERFPSAKLIEWSLRYPRRIIAGYNCSFLIHVNIYLAVSAVYIPLYGTRWTNQQKRLVRRGAYSASRLLPWYLQNQIFDFKLFPNLGLPHVRVPSSLPSVVLTLLEDEAFVYGMGGGTGETQLTKLLRQSYSTSGEVYTFPSTPRFRTTCIRKTSKQTVSNRSCITFPHSR